MSTIYSQFNSLFVDIKNFFINLYNMIHDFLGNYLDDTALGVFGIILIAGILIFIFRKISDK